MKNKYPFLLLILSATLFLILFYGKVILHPDNYLFNNSGDAIKNYYTYSYHITHDSSYVNFSGMNFPYGEHFLYTDCHPVLANLFKSFSSFSAYFTTHSIGILNFIMIFSIFLTFIAIYFLLLEFKIRQWFALLFSIGITLLAPQIFRLEGHLSLSYSFAIPFSWLLVVRFQRTGRRFCLVILFINCLFWMFIHAYLGVMIVSFILVFMALNILSNRRNRQQTMSNLLSLAAILIPLLLFFVYLKLTDTHTGRSDSPSGFFLYNAELDDIFLPSQGPVRTFLNRILGDIIKQEWEALSYVGIATTMITLVVLVHSVISIFRKAARNKRIHFFNNRNLNYSLIAASIVLLFAMGFPFKQIPYLLDYFPVFKQFRATGRFDWPFFFVAIVFSAKVLQDLYTNASTARTKTIILTLILLFSAMNILEAIPYHKRISQAITRFPNLFRKEMLTVDYKNAINSIDPDKYQAIITVPFYYQGSETFTRPRDEEAVRASIVISYHTGLPNVCANLSRTSIMESKKIIQLVSPDYYRKEIYSDFSSTKPFLIVRTGALLTPYEDALISKANLFYSGSLKLYSLQFQDLFKSSAALIYDNYLKIKPKLTKRNIFLAKDSSLIIYKDFERTKSPIAFRGTGAFVSEKKGKHTIVEFQPKTFLSGKQYSISIWMYNKDPDALNDWFRLMIEEYNSVTDEWFTTTLFPDHAETINGNWSLVEGTFRLSNPNNKVFVVIEGKKYSKARVIADDLLIRESGNDVYRYDDSSESLFYNNQEVKLK